MRILLLGILFWSGLALAQTVSLTTLYDLDCRGQKVLKTWPANMYVAASGIYTATTATKTNNGVVWTNVILQGASGVGTSTTQTGWVPAQGCN